MFIINLAPFSTGSSVPFPGCCEAAGKRGCVDHRLAVGSVSDKAMCVRSNLGCSVYYILKGFYYTSGKSANSSLFNKFKHLQKLKCSSFNCLLF